MEKFIGIKEIQAIPMNRLAYSQYRGWKLPEDENGEDQGYLVEYLDGGESNHPDHKGYISWSPKDVFERAYADVDDNESGIMALFKYEHLPPHLQEVSKPLGQLARIMDALPDGAEKSAGLRKLLEAKDCFVRAKLT
ncbi:hypothetical protein [Vibrio sp. SCSIO 43136]|uniref:hypothetical protein n=1 Tax=Vibrio sp. SCSIO 43136 TaxID=2819101 RepID=UPI0020757E37|nr:hypothetical protein [Vibrio sp. SCSIO 43136]USD66733.1 hypothetical protein J4N39_08870 [Vibrio sp. SCSIO 43136]